MKARRRVISLVLCILMFATLLPQPLKAAQTIYFTSVNDMLLDLSDETMPFWQGSTLYVASTVFDRNKSDLGTTYSRSRDKMTAIIYRNRDVLVCDLSTGNIENNSTHEILSGSAVVRGDVVFFPVNTIAKFFGFDYSCVKVDYGYLVRVKNETVVLPDSAFIDAASATMTQRYKQYQKMHSSSSEYWHNGENGSGSGNGIGNAYLFVTVSEAAASEKILSALSNSGVTATFLLSAQEIEQMPDLVRHIIVSGSSIALEIDAAKSEKATISLIEKANDTLWAVSNTKTRFVALQTADAGIRDRVAAAGFCVLSAELDYSDALPTSSRVANGISSRISKTGQCAVFLGKDVEVQNMIGGLLSILRTSGCAAQHINEIAALS